MGPLPTLRAPRDEPLEKETAPLPTLRTVRAASPVEDENTVITVEPRYDSWGFDLNILERNGPIQTPENAHPASLLTAGYVRTSAVPMGNDPFLLPSTSRAMTGQTMRSFESRPMSAPDVFGAKANTPAKTTPLGRTSSTVVTFDEIAPSELELYQQGGLLPAVKGEKVGQHRERTDENELRLCTHIVQINRRIEELERRSVAQHREALLRIEEIISNAAPSSATSTATTFADDIARLKAMNTEGRAAIGNMTNALNELVDLPREVAGLSRAIANITTTSRAAPEPSLGSLSAPGSSNMPTDTTNKRDRPFAGFGEPGAKRHKQDEPSYTDIYLWDVNTKDASPAKIAHTAMERLGLNSTNAFVSVQNARNKPRSVISIRFKDSDVADHFVDALRANAPASMKHLHAAKPAVYEKRASGASDKRAEVQDDPW